MCALSCFQKPLESDYRAFSRAIYGVSVLKINGGENDKWKLDLEDDDWWFFCRILGFDFRWYLLVCFCLRHQWLSVVNCERYILSDFCNLWECEYILYRTI